MMLPVFLAARAIALILMAATCREFILVKACQSEILVKRNINYNPE